MATGAFVSCVIDYTGRGFIVVFAAPTPNSWTASGAVETVSGTVVTVNGLGITVTVLSALGDGALTVSGHLEGVVHLNDIITITGPGGWITDNGLADQTGPMSAETITNNSIQLQDEV